MTFAILVKGASRSYPDNIEFADGDTIEEAARLYMLEHARTSISAIDTTMKSVRQFELQRPANPPKDQWDVVDVTPVEEES